MQVTVGDQSIQGFTKATPFTIDETGRAVPDHAATIDIAGMHAGQIAAAIRGLAPLTFAELRAANQRRLPQFKDAHGRPAHSEPDGSDWSDAEWLQAVVGELGEFANIAKKLRRGDFTREEALPMMRDELADVACYLDILAFRLGIDLGEAVRDKFNRVSERVGSDVKL